ncbi:cytochrome b5-like heme/steroid binding domain-containing protein [Cokeromyces recurvatus]|uniref:cytochrome b5-like heme/steroid binding domain-containing protein n=1 Tax=Cokeromyces recurvatus TaxID=90255 RepID=UPI00222053D6|nr:cytochrome b5-like heme/steroid binding domain-containing protein [Cokeromyces recurvatus]KAI7898308.1 cytochrome b5-like heme/steroid binding domain-containing protein [Cokeromyces recurvatus]
MATEAPKATPITVSELSKYDGSDPSLPIYVAIKGDVFDVSKNTSSYGKGSGYNVFAGKDSSKALGKSSLKPEDCIGDYSDLTEKELETLNQWYTFFSKRYNIVGKVVPDN